ncbi:hypothetical protein [uncultured Selenomonas sp.]|uniref:hypothetical protein n=1 Tax=uncultured Selenomonas sp. TaxID=159275 RepID=UPI0026006EFA|nr:hypothetical protein [uncultured Selenomonas sp.]
MIIFPVFSELEKKRDEVNAHFHKETEPQLIERVQQFGFVPVQPGDMQHMLLKESSTQNEYLLTFRPYEIRVEFCHVKTQEKPERPYNHEHPDCLDRQLAPVRRRLRLPQGAGVRQRAKKIIFRF